MGEEEKGREGRHVFMLVLVSDSVYKQNLTLLQVIKIGLGIEDGGKGHVKL